MINVCSYSIKVYSSSNSLNVEYIVLYTVGSLWCDLITVRESLEEWKRDSDTHTEMEMLLHSFSFYIPVGRILYLLLVNACYRVATFATHLARPWPPANGLHIVIEIIGLHLIILGAAAAGCRAASSSAAGITTRCGFACRAHALEMLTGCVHRDHLGGVSAGGRGR